MDTINTVTEGTLTITITLEEYRALLAAQIELGYERSKRWELQSENSSLKNELARAKVKAEAE